MLEIITPRCAMARGACRPATGVERAVPGGGAARRLAGRARRAAARSYKVIKRIARISLSADVLDNSATLPPQELSPAQAIHLASALAVKRDLTAFVTYDEDLLAAAKDAGLPVTSPGSP